MHPAVWWLIAIGVAASGLGFGAKETGEGVDAASNGIVKIVVAAGGGYLIAKHFKVI